MLPLTTFDVAFPIGLGLMFGISKYARYLQAGMPDAKSRAALEALKGMVGAGAIMFAYKLLGIL